MGHRRREQLVNEQRIREIYAGVMASRGKTRSAGACPAPEAILALVRREGTEDARLATLDHVMSCAECRSEFDLLRSIEEAGTQAGAARPAYRRWTMPVALAASVLFAVVIGRYMLPAAPDDEVFRGDDSGVTLLAPPPEVAAGTPIAFAWHPIPGATRYRLEVLSTGGELALEAETADTTVTLRGTADLAPGDYQWWVGSTVAGAPTRSAFRPLRLTPQ
jgi:hypothetical protein